MRANLTKMATRLVVVAGLVAVLGSVAVRSATVHLYVSPQGSDSNDGRQPGRPLKRLQHAVDLLQSDAIKGNDVFLELMQGYHDLQHTLYFNRALHGTVVVRAYQGQEVHVSGGRRIPSGQFQPVTDSHALSQLSGGARRKVQQLDLTAAGLMDPGTLRQYGFYFFWKAPLEVFINGRPLRLAEWPNGGKFINIKSIPDGQNGTRFTYDAAGRDRKWAHETEPWVYGWWYWSWADSSLPVSDVDSHSHTISLATPSQYGLRVGHYDPDRSIRQAGFTDQGGYFRVTNMLCELDQPGEYYIDRANKKLYVWPNTPHQTLTSSDIVYASMVDQCISISSGVRNLHFEDFTVENCRMFGFDVHDGRQLYLKNMEVKNTGSFGFYCTKDCRHVSVLASEFHDVGGGVRVEGGDRATLTPSGVMIADNHMWDFSRVGAIPCDAVHLNGVGVTVAHNHLHHGQYTAVRWAGNDHVIEYNDVHHVCWNSSDCGAIHSGRDWTWRGTVIRYNRIHDTLRHLPGADVRGIMLDDEYSSVLIENNVFYNNDVHANIGGGRDNVIRNNVMYNAASYSIQVDGRGMTSGGFGPYLRQQLQKVPYQTALWQNRYPQLATILTESPDEPRGNQIYNNAFYNPSGSQKLHYLTNTQRKEFFSVHDNYYAHRATDFWAPERAEFSLRCEATDWAQRTHFPRPVSAGSVGPRVPTGPHYLRAARGHSTASPHTAQPAPCDTSTAAPATTAPRAPYMPDGSRPNTLYPHTSKQGCWFVIDHCPHNASAEGTHPDHLGTATGTEEGCLSRAAPQWRWCGSPADGKVVALWGPTGAMTFAAEGCYMAEYGYGCADNNPGFHRDTYGEQHDNGAHDEEACLSRAVGQWFYYCHGNTSVAITSVFGPTGKFRVSGGGCWIKITSCPAHHDLQGFFYDAWGATNQGTDTDQTECFERASYFWNKCGSHDNAPVTAFYRPQAANHTVP